MHSTNKVPTKKAPAKEPSTRTRFLLIASGGGLLVLAVVFVLLVSRPSRPGEEIPPMVGDLQQVNDLLHVAAGETGRVPDTFDGLGGRANSLYPRGYEAVQSGEIVVLWGAPLQGEGEVGKNEAVVAYEKNVPTEGGYVLFSAGTVKKLTAAEFQAMPKSQP
jgi:hypothetical protein